MVGVPLFYSSVIRMRMLTSASTAKKCKKRVWSSKNVGISDSAFE